MNAMSDDDVIAIVDDHRVSHPVITIILFIFEIKNIIVFLTYVNTYWA